MYYTYENGKLVAKGDQYENPSSYIQYGTNETGMNGGKANGWEQGVSDTASGVMQGMGLGMWEQLGKAGYNGLKSTNSEAGDGFAHFFAPHHTVLGNLDDSINAKTDEDRKKNQRNGILSLFGLGMVADVLRGRDKRAKEASANYINNTNPFLFALDDKGLQFANPKAKAPAPVGDKTWWLKAIGSMAGSAIKQGMAAKKEKNAVSPNTEADLNQDQPKNLAFMQNPLGDNPAIDNSYKESATRFDINRGDNGRDFMYQDKTGPPWDQTYGFNKGGSVQVKGGKGNDDIALVDTNTGEDTGVRVEKDEMIVFSKKNVEALEKAIASGKKGDVFKIVKDQLAQHPEVKEGETMFKGGGKYSGLSDAEVKKMYHDETAKPFGQVVINNLWDLEKEMDSRKMPYKEWHYLSDEARKAIDDFVAVPANTVKGVLWDAPLAISKKVDNYGDPIKDPEGYKHILQTKAEQLYIKRHGEPKVDLGGLGMKFDRKKLKEIEDEIRAQDIEKAKNGENVNKVMPSDNEKPTYKDRSAKDALGMLFPDAEKAVQDAKNKKDGIPVVKLDLSKKSNGQSGWSQPNTRTSSSSKTTTTTSGQRTASADNVNISDKSIAMKGVAQQDPSMLNVTDIAGKLQMPYAKTVDTAPETVKQDWLGDTLGYAGDALKLGLGMSAATKKLPEWTISDNWNEYMGKLKFMSNMGLSPEQKAQYLDTADRTYQYDLSNIYNLSNGNAGTVLGNIGRANMSRYRSGVDLAIADKNAELANNAVYGNLLGRDEQYRKSIFDENRNGLLMTKQAGMQLASDALANMENRADYNKFYGKGSQVEKLQNLQLEEQQTKNDILKAQKDNASNPEFWKTYNSGKSAETNYGTNLFDAVKGATPEQIEALKKLWS